MGPLSMKKRLAGAALITSSLLIVSHSGQMNIGNINNESVTRTIQSGQTPVTLVETIDGDTIKVKLNKKVETVRYLLVDTPESKKLGMCVQPYAVEASERNNQLVRTGPLTLEFEKGVGRDAYGRLLAYVYANGRSVGETLLKEGFARVAYILNPPYKYLSSYQDAETFAQKNKAKIWSKANYVTNWGFNGCAE
jgi:micrococcal nuclease